MEINPTTPVAAAGSCAKTGICSTFKSTICGIVSPIFNGSLFKSIGSSGIIKGIVTWSVANPLSCALCVLAIVAVVTAVVKTVQYYRASAEATEV